MNLINLHSIISSEQIWQLFGLVNLILLKVLFIIISWKRGYNLKNTILLITGVIVGASVGSVILPSYLGGLLGALVVIPLLYKILSIEDDYFALLTMLGLLSITVARSG